MPMRRGAGTLIFAVTVTGLAFGAAGSFHAAAAQDATPTPAISATVGTVPSGGGATPTLSTTASGGTLPAPTAQASPEQSYADWLQAHVARELTVVQAVPTSLDLGSAGWRRDLALALDSWGALIQQARDQRPPSNAQSVHRTLLDALDSLDRARRMLLVASATGQDPGPELAATVAQGRQDLARMSELARALAEGRVEAGTRPSGARGNLRVTVLGGTRPYVERGTPAEAGFEYFNVRLRLESIAGEPVVYDAYHFRVRTADQTDHVPTPVGVADELLYGALEGNRLAGEIVGNVVFPVRAGVPVIGLFYASDLGDAPLIIPLGEPLPTPIAPPTPRPGT